MRLPIKRRAVSMRVEIYGALREHCDDAGISMSSYVESLITRDIASQPPRIEAADPRQVDIEEACIHPSS